MFTTTRPLFGGLLWYTPFPLPLHTPPNLHPTTTNPPPPSRKIPWKLSSLQKARQRKRLKLVDQVVDTVSTALQRNGGMTTKAVERWYKEMPREEEMLPKNKYTIFDRKEKKHKYRKGIHSELWWVEGEGGRLGLMSVCV